MTLIDRYNEIEKYCTLEEYSRYVSIISYSEKERVSKLNAFDFAMSMPDTIRKRMILSDVFKELYNQSS
jgi:hypothetical protein